MDQPNITIHTQHRRIEALEKNQRENKIKCDSRYKKLKHLNNHILGLSNNLNLLRAAEIKHWEKIDQLQKKWNRHPIIVERLRTAQLKGDRELKAEINEIRKTVQALKGGGKTKKRRKRRTRKPKKKRKGFGGKRKRKIRTRRKKRTKRRRARRHRSKKRRTRRRKRRIGGTLVATEATKMAE